MSFSLMVDVNDHELEEIEKAILAHPMVAAVLLFARNYQNREQLTRLIQAINAIKPDLFIAVDQEGGYVQRFQRHGFRAIPSARVIGEIYDDNPEEGIKAAKRYGCIMAEDLLACGVDLSLAPVIDLHGESQIIGGFDRAFHKNPQAVAQLAEAFIEGMNAAGMPAVGKHFPGHGSFRSDSHITKPIYNASYAHLLENDLKPFITLIQKKKLHAIMPAHVIYSQIDPENPAGFSTTWLQEILRGQLKFNGLILSDCLSMAGADIGDLKTRAECAFAAGCNMAIIANQPRAVLLDLLQSFDACKTKEIAPYLENFKQEMHRFKSKFGVREGGVANALWRKEETFVQPINTDLNRTTGI